VLVLVLLQVSAQAKDGGGSSGGGIVMDGLIFDFIICIEY